MHLNSDVVHIFVLYGKFVEVNQLWLNVNSERSDKKRSLTQADVKQTKNRQMWNRYYLFPTVIIWLLIGTRLAAGREEQSQFYCVIFQSLMCRIL